MNIEIAALKGHLADLKALKLDLDLKIDANIKAAKALLSASAIRPIDQIDVEGASVNLQEAVAMKKERAKVLEKIAAIEMELA